VVKTMKYETPELTALAPAINAILSAEPGPPKIPAPVVVDSPTWYAESVAGYMDWED
jgi:hypothetical protein